MPRKQFAPVGPTPTTAHMFAAFIAALLSGTVVATKLYVVRPPGQGKRRLEYDEP